MRHGLILTAGSTRGNVALGQRAEQAGFDSVLSVEFFNQHAFVVLGGLAATTSRIRLGTGIANAFTRAPLVHATAAMDLDELSGGRMILGLGSGTRRMNVEWWGMPFEKPAGRMKELIEVLRAVFAAGNGFGFRFKGRFWDLKIPVFTRPGARPDLPIWVAAVNQPMLRSAGAAADAVVGHPIATRRWHREVTLPTLRAAEAAAGRPAGACALVPYLLTSINPDRALALQDAKQQIGFYYTVKVYHSILALHGLPEVAAACRQALASFDIAAMAAAIPDALVDEIAIVATDAAEAREKLRQWDGLCDEVLFYAPSVGVPGERVGENNERILAAFAAKT
ncbi:MAG: LLM class flavin-dependent oxidoreductase [Deltaproteobacteria bacterium]|nr:LLM class flavin-dependent oxidoreductase [Deltaproteobacteria bacterium]